MFFRHVYAFRSVVGKSVRKYSNVAGNVTSIGHLSYLERRVDMIEKNLNRQEETVTNIIRQQPIFEKEFKEKVSDIVAQKVMMNERGTEIKIEVLTSKVLDFEKNVDKRLDKIEYFQYRTFIAIFIMVCTSVLGPHLQPLIDKIVPEKK